MREKKKSKKIIVISIVVAIAVLAIIAIAVYMLLNTQQLKLYDTTIELGQENYIEQIIKEDNIYIKEGYTYTVKDSKIDIKNAGTYDLTFEIKGEGKTIEETKQIRVVDTTPPTVKLKQDTFYIGDNINIEEIVKIQDLSQEGEIAYSDANAKIEGQFDTSKEGESKVTISVTDKNGNTGTQELKVKVKNPIVSVYEYVEEKLKNSDYTFVPASFSKDNHIYIGYDPCSYYIHSYDGWIDLTDKMSYHFTTIYRKDKVPHSVSNGVGKSYLYYFNNDYTITKGYIDEISIHNKKADIKLSEFTERKDIKGAKESELNEIDKLLNNNGKIRLVGKTIDQIKRETIDLRELE